MQANFGTKTCKTNHYDGGMKQRKPNLMARNNKNQNNGTNFFKTNSKSRICNASQPNWHEM